MNFAYMDGGKMGKVSTGQQVATCDAVFSKVAYSVWGINFVLWLFAP